jgi:hypothetical protein
MNISDFFAVLLVAARSFHTALVLNDEDVSACNPEMTTAFYSDSRKQGVEPLCLSIVQE